MNKNGDYESLIHTLEDIRLTNPDTPLTINNSYQDTSHSSPNPAPHLSARSRYEDGVVEETLYRHSNNSYLPAVARGHLDDLGFDPAAYSPDPHYSSDSPTTQNPGGSSSSMSYETQNLPNPQVNNLHPNRPQPYSNSRPTSGIYNHPNLSTSSSAMSANTYARMRTDSDQMMNGSGMRRSSSRSQAAAAQTPSLARDQAGTGMPYRQPSTSNPFARGWPPRQTSRLMSGEQDAGYDSTPSSRHPSYPNEGGTLPTTTEEWKEKGAAVGVQHSVDERGNKTSKMVKKGVKDFNFGRTLGEGSYSTVLAATDRQSQREYAIKVLDKRHIIKEKKVKYVNIEKDTLNRLTDHPGIVKLYYTFQDERSLYFVLDLAAGGELLGVLKKTTSFDEECTRFYSAQLLDAVEYMHSRGIIHRDLKPENLLLDDAGHIKITDFGTAKILDLPKEPTKFGNVSVGSNTDGSETDRAVSFVGTAEYVSPELLTDKNACKASDLWAFGCIVYQLLAGRPPFKAANEYQTFQKIVNLDYTFPEGFPAIARDLITKLLVLDPAERLSIDGIKRHAFFDGVQWGKGQWKTRPPKLRAYNAQTQEANNVDRSRTEQQSQQQQQQQSQHQVLSPQSQAQTLLPKPTMDRPRGGSSSSIPPNAMAQRPKPRIITELAPPTQLDIDWSPVLTRANERILKLGQFIVHSAPAPHSPTSRSGAESVEQPSKFAKFFGASTTKKRQRLVMITSSGRLIIVPAGGDRKEVKVVVDLAESDVSWRSQQDSKGYNMWCVFTVSRLSKKKQHRLTSTHTQPLTLFT